MTIYNRVQTIFIHIQPTSLDRGEFYCSKISEKKTPKYSGILIKVKSKQLINDDLL